MFFSPYLVLCHEGHPSNVYLNLVGDSRVQGFSANLKGSYSLFFKNLKNSAIMKSQNLKIESFTLLPAIMSTLGQTAGYSALRKRPNH